MTDYSTFLERKQQSYAVESWHSDTQERADRHEWQSAGGGDRSLL